MNRRDFLVVSSATGLLASLNGIASARPRAAGSAPHLIPADKGFTPEMLAALRQRGTRRVYRGADRFAIGMPCGGIAAGQLYLLGDGSLGGWHVDGAHNNSGWGADNYKVRVQPRELLQGFTVLLPGGADAKAKWVATRLTDPEHGGAFGQIEFIGEYPLAEVRYGPASDPTFPLAITLHAGSPFIPLNAKDSCLPCTVLRFTVRNTSKSKVQGTLVGHLENQIDKAGPGEIAGVRRNRSIAGTEYSTLMMDAVPAPDAPNPRAERVLFDFESPHYDGWEVKGPAFGLGPATGRFPSQQPVSGFQGKQLVNSYNNNDDLTGEMTSEAFVIDRHFLTFLIGGGSWAGKTCVNLLVDSKPVRTAAGKSEERLAPRTWDVREFEGKSARLQIVDAQKGPWGHINVDDFRLTDQVPQASKRPSPESLTTGTMALAGPGACVTSLGDPAALDSIDTGADHTKEARAEGDALLVGGIAAPFTLEPGQERELTFVLGWHYPNLHTGNGVMYSNWFQNAGEVVEYVRKELPRLTRQTELFRKTWYDDTTLPYWLAARLFMPTSNLATGTAQWWKNGRFWCWEGVGSCEGTCTHVWNYSHAEARLFPELERSTRVMQDLGSAIDESTGRVAFRGEVNNGFSYAADGQSGTVLKCYREHLCSPDNSFLKANWARIKKVLEYQIGRDGLLRGEKSSAEPDGIIEVTQHNTFDINFEGPNTFVGALYLAALHAGAKMAELMGEKPLADRYRSIAAAGRAYTEKNLFKHGYFVQEIPADASTRWQYGIGCLSDQLFGQNWARCLNLGTVYDEKKVNSAYKAIYTYNWSPAVGQYSAVYPPERWFAEGREGGLFVCTWPFGERMPEPIRYRDEIWTGEEYQAAGGMAWEGDTDPALVDQALVIVNAIDQRYEGAARNPWNEVECGDHYGRAMASYGVYQALCGFTLDGPAGEIGIAPRLSPEKFASFFSGPEGWGLAGQTRDETSQSNRFEVRHGTLNVRSLLAQAPAGAKVAGATVRAGDNEVPATFEQSGTSVRVRVAQAITLKAYQALEVMLKF